jgi:hypothetical protein
VRKLVSKFAFSHAACAAYAAVASGGDVSFFVCTYVAAVKYCDVMKS